MGTGNIQLRLEIITSKLSRLKELDKDFHVFGSEYHKYKFNERLSKEDIQNYQNEKEIILPEEYAQFLMHIGNGGAGPCYGLSPLQENENEVNAQEKFPYDIDSPFYIDGKYDEFYERMANCSTVEEEDIVCEEKDKIADLDYLNSLKGFIELCHEGCAMYDILIVNGRDKGSVWFFDFANDFGVVPLINPNNGKAMNFLDWYELWLDNEIEYFESDSKAKESFGSYIMYTKQR